MKEAIALPVMRTRTVGIEYLTFVVDVAGIEEFVMGVARLATTCQIWTDVIELAEAAREVDVGGVFQTRVTDYEESVLE